MFWIKYIVKKYTNRNGRCLLDEYVSDLLAKNKKNEIAQINLYINILGDLGYEIHKYKQYSKHLEGKLYELRPGKHRIIYFYHDVEDNSYVLLHAFKKSTQKTPLSEIEKAKREVKEYERMKKNEKSWKIWFIWKCSWYF